VHACIEVTHKSMKVINPLCHKAIYAGNNIGSLEGLKFGGEKLS